MAKLSLTDSEDVTAERLREALSTRLSSNYAVFVRENSDSVKVGKDALMAIIVEAHPKKGRTEFVTAYNPGSWALAVPFMMLLLPIFLFVYLRGSLERYELEAEVIEALRDKWPTIEELD
ncbi:MAG: hypothetical protein DRI30_01390 [Chloroflexi bacterium]|nr:MAG: hypothetical protein DRI30_01390 [Chloroflexota bacterium]